MTVLNITDIYEQLDTTEAGKEGKQKVTFLPEPEPRPRYYTVISVDDHLIETPAIFEGRIPSSLADRAPRLEETSQGGLVWNYDGVIIPNIGLSAVKGRPLEEYSLEPTRFEHMRRGAYDPVARLHDMDLNGVHASLNFPSQLAGFAGQRLQLSTKDVELARACVRAHNAWHVEEWSAADPGRLIPAQLPWLLDPVEAAAEIRANAERGFRAVCFAEAPQRLGLPSLHSGHWDPFFAACEETGTVVNLHIGASGYTVSTADDAPPETWVTLFFATAMLAAVDWLFSGVPSRFPNLRIVLSEGGLGWVGGLLDRLDHVEKYMSIYGNWTDELSPSEVLLRNFWFCAVDDATSFRTIDRIGVENVLVEADYPHVDSTWPDTQEVLRRSLTSLDSAAVEAVTWRNASELYRLPVPDSVHDGRVAPDRGRDRG